MLAIRGDDGASEALDRARRRLRNRVPVLSQRVQRLMRLAELAAGGPDPEVAVARLLAAHKSLETLLRSIPLR